MQVTDFGESKNTITNNELIKGRRVYSNDGCLIKILCFCGRAIITADEQIIRWVKENLEKEDANWLFEYPKLRFIDEKLNELGHEIADIHHYYIPRAGEHEITPLFEVKWFEQEDIQQFKDDERFCEALAFEETHPDVLAVAAFDGDRIMGMAGASADSETMWQIGIDVIPEYRGKGVGTNLTGLLKQEILQRGKIPFYGTVESHNISKNIAINAGFVPAWAEAYSKKV
ncbi:MAG TPA: GNAT family N-acetyltransferase [Bacillales bacterium]